MKQKLPIAKSKTMLKNISFMVLIAMSICALGQTAEAAAVGPLDPVIKFPLYYTDDKGVCVAGPPPKGDGLKTPTNIFTPVIAGNPISVSNSFGSEYFYWHATVDRQTFRTRSGSVEVTFGLMATYAGGIPRAGQQIVLSRIRLRAALLPAGTYTFDHPYGTETFNVTTNEPINFTRDIGGAPEDFNAVIAQGGDVLKGFLVANTIAANPETWIGDGVTLSTVTGGPIRNFVKLTAPVGVNLDGRGANFIQTNLFIVSGHLWHHQRRHP